MAEQLYDVVSSDALAVFLERANEKNGNQDMIVLKFPTYVLNEPLKPIAERPQRARKNGKSIETGKVEIPKAATFVMASKQRRGPKRAEFASEYRVQLRVDRKISDAKRKELYQDCLRRGLAVAADSADELDQGVPAEGESDGLTRLA